jgi:mRNA interferase YafQ
MYAVHFQPSFIRDLKKYKRSGGDIERVHKIIDMLRTGDVLPASLRDHQLMGKIKQYRELHVEHDQLLVYEKNGKELRIMCIWLVTHKKLRERGRSI